jgi:hypothetical protein
MVDAVKAAIEAAPKPKRLTWGEIWRRQQGTWAHMSPDEPKRARTTQYEVDCEAGVDNRARALEGVCEPR